jgi:hypothetical protein
MNDSAEVLHYLVDRLDTLIMSFLHTQLTPLIHAFHDYKLRENDYIMGKLKNINRYYDDYFSEHIGRYETPLSFAIKYKHVIRIVDVINKSNISYVFRYVYELIYSDNIINVTHKMAILDDLISKINKLKSDIDVCCS